MYEYLVSVIVWVSGHPMEKTFKDWLLSSWVCHVWLMPRKYLALPVIIFDFQRTTQVWSVFKNTNSDDLFGLL